MAPQVNPIPEGYHTVTPVLAVHGAAKLIDFMKQAFNAKETYRLDGPNGTLMHVELQIGDSMIMVGEATDQWKPMQATVALYVQDTDSWYQRALRAGATSVREPSDQFLWRPQRRRQGFRREPLGDSYAYRRCAVGGDQETRGSVDDAAKELLNARTESAFPYLKSAELGILIPC